MNTSYMNSLKNKEIYSPDLFNKYIDYSVFSI